VTTKRGRKSPADIRKLLCFLDLKHLKSRVGMAITGKKTKKTKKTGEESETQ
jgi:hypothetical protein